MRKLVLILVCIGLLSLPFSAMAATEAQKRAAIEAGLAYLATQQNANGSIGTGGTDYLLSQTGAALLAFLEEKPNWGANTAAYQAVVDNGLNYLFSQASIVNIANQTAGNPDGDGNGVGVKFYPGGANSRDTYVTGIVLPAIASTGTPGAVVTTGPLTGWTYQQVVQNVIDYFAFGQSEAATGVYRGGWRYYANYGNSDQSTTQWPVIASLYGTKMGVNAPAFVKSELNYWIQYIQYLGGVPNTGDYGAAGYTGPTSAYGRVNETGALLIEMAWNGYGLGNSRVQAALDFLNRAWQLTPSSYEGNFGHPYGMWAVYKGLELMIGLEDNTWITNLHAQGGALLDPGDIWNWWEDYCEFLVNAQLGNGSWNGYSSWSSYLATPWYINILAATQIPGPEPNGEVPEPATMILLGSGLVGLAGYARRRMKK